VTEVIADVVLVLSPHGVWISRLTELKDGSKEILERMARLQCRCLFRALVPLAIILKQPTGNTGIPVRVICNTLVRAKVGEGSWTLSHTEQCSETKNLPSLRRHEVNLTQCTTPSALLKPMPCLLVVCKMHGELLICILPGHLS
jgi:hypothetical protein